MTELELMGGRNRETDFSTQSHKELSKESMLPISASVITMTKVKQ